MKAKIQQKEDALWLTRAELMEQEGVEMLAFEGRSTLRSEPPSEVEKQQATQTRRVS